MIPVNKYSFSKMFLKINYKVQLQNVLISAKTSKKKFYFASMIIILLLA